MLMKVFAFKSCGKAPKIAVQHRRALFMKLFNLKENCNTEVSCSVSVGYLTHLFSPSWGCGICRALSACASRGRATVLRCHRGRPEDPPSGW